MNHANTEPVSDQDSALKPSLAESVVKGSFWIFSLRLTNRMLGLLRTVVLARLLMPEDFGVVGIAALVIATLETFSQPGLATALVQKKESIQDSLDTAWTTSVVRSILIFVLLLLIAPWVARFFNSSQARLVIQFLAVSVIIAGCRNIGIIYFQKELNFKNQYLYDVSVTLGNIAVAIPAAVLLGNVWALVLGAIAGSITRFFMSYVLQAYRPRLRFDKEKFGQLFAYGKWVLGSSVLVFLATQGDDIFLGKMFGAAALGFYQMAYMISNLPTTEVTQILSHVTFPAYAKLQDDRDRLKDAYLRVMQMIACFAIPLSGGLFIFSHDLVAIVLSKKWLPLVPLVKVLVWSGLMRALMESTIPIFNAMAKPRTHTKWQLTKFVVLAVSIYPLARQWGTAGVAAAVLAATGIATIGSLYDAKKLVAYETTVLIKILAIPFMSMLLPLGIVYWGRGSIGSHPFFAGVMAAVIGILVYLAGIYFFDKTCDYNMGSIVKESILLLRAK
jgi:O-antigen/teichoic acid export membrane protein